MKREDAKEIHKFIIDTIKREKYGFVTDSKLDLSSPTVGSLPARKIVITDAGNYYTSSTLEEALQETISGAVRIGSGVLTSGIVNSFAFAWQNPNPVAIMVEHVIIDVTSSGVLPNSVMDVGIVADATSTADNIFDGLNLIVVGIHHSYNAVDAGTNGVQKRDAVTEFIPLKMAAKDGANDYITGKILVANASTLAGKYYIYYTIT